MEITCHAVLTILKLGVVLPGTYCINRKSQPIISDRYDAYTLWYVR